MGKRVSDKIGDKSILLIVAGITALTLISAVLAQQFNNSQPYSRNPKLESVLSQLINASDMQDFARAHNLYMQDGKVRVIVELANETVLLPDYVVEEARYKNNVQALIPVEKIAALSEETNVTFIRAPLKPYADTATVIPATTSTPSLKSGFDSTFPIILSMLLIFLIRKIRKS